jgi:isopenicillin-N N-acyltransferase-like protein
MEHALPYLEVSGGPGERGRAHGEVFRDEIQNLLPAYFEYLDSVSRSSGVEPLTKTRALEISATYLEPTERYAPDLMVEARGIAEAADVSFEELFCLNAFLDMFDFLSPPFVQSGCTSLMVPGNLKGEGALIAQNYDLPAYFSEAAILLRVVDSDVPSSLFYTNAGMLGCSGMNELGISVVINNLVPSDSGPGVPYPFIIRKVLETERIGDAIDAVGAATRASGMNYVLCDKHGEIYSIESSARDYEVLVPFDGPMAHANHYLAERLKPLECRAWSQRGQSILRWGRATRLLKGHGSLEPEDLREILGDRVNAPIGICRKNVNGCGETICGIVLSPPEGKAWFVRVPSEDEWVAYGVSKETRPGEGAESTKRGRYGFG